MNSFYTWYYLTKAEHLFELLDKYGHVTIETAEEKVWWANTLAFLLMSEYVTLSTHEGKDVFEKAIKWEHHYYYKAKARIESLIKLTAIVIAILAIALYI